LNFINIKYLSQVISIRILGDYYSFADILKEACWAFHKNPLYFKLYNYNSQMVNLISAVNAYMNTIPSDYKTRKSLSKL